MNTKQQARHSLATRPRIGLFWYYNKELLVYSLPAAEAEVQCGCIDIDIGHDDLWPTFQKLDPYLRTLNNEDLPRGRVLYDRVTRRFRIYTSNKLIQARGFQKKLLRTFNLTTAKAVFESKQNYEVTDSVKKGE